MADNWTQSIVCRYYKNGICREGENCRYHHAQTSSVAQPIVQNGSENTVVTAAVATCRFFKWGSCKFGARCRFIHNAETNVAETEDIRPLSDGNNGPRSEGTSDAESVPSTISHKMNDTVLTVNEWVNTPEFVPSSMLGGLPKCSDESASSTSAPPTTYARAVSSSSYTPNAASEPLCPYAEASGICKRIDCPYLHGLTCEMCGSAALHPFNDELRQQHTTACVKQHEADMELSFAIQRSRDKSCGVCFEVIMEKSTREQRFGILPNCNHCFCLSCIRRWRLAKQFDNKIIRSCPECRVASDFVCPSTYWVDTKEEKEKLIVEYKEALSLKNCKYFDKGRGKCPFGNKCFYLHALPDGTKTDVGPPVRPASFSDDVFDLFQNYFLRSFIEDRENNWLGMDYHDELDIDYLDSDISDWSD